MKSFASASAVLALLSALPAVYSHGLILAANGANGVSTQGFGVDPSTPRDCSLPGTCEQDTSIIRDDEVQSGKASACGRTEENGAVDIQSEMSKAVSNGLATASPSGAVTLTVHQVNQDGAGPYTCDVDTSGTGQNFQEMTVTQNVPGSDLPIIGSLSGAQATNFQLVAQMPQGATCSGAGGACLVRCRNAAIAGPFGSCVAVTNAGGAGNSTASSSGKRDLTTREIELAREAAKVDPRFARVLRSRIARALFDESA